MSTILSLIFMKHIKDAYYFSHDSNAKDDPKCVLLIEQLGLEGYGIFRILIETLRDQPNFSYPLKLISALARRYNTTTEKMKAVVLSYDLFKLEEENFFVSESLNRRMGIYLDKKKKLSEAGKKGNALRWGNQNIATRSAGDQVVIANKINESKAKQNLFFKEIDDDFNLFFDKIPPNDGTNRNWDGLKIWLLKIRATKEQANEIIGLSNFGEIGTPIWKLFSEITNAGGTIKQPVAFILSRLKQ